MQRRLAERRKRRAAAEAEAAAARVSGDGAASPKPELKRQASVGRKEGVFGRVNQALRARMMAASLIQQQRLMEQAHTVETTNTRSKQGASVFDEDEMRKLQENAVVTLKRLQGDVQDRHTENKSRVQQRLEQRRRTTKKGNQIAPEAEQY